MLTGLVRVHSSSSTAEASIVRLWLVGLGTGSSSIHSVGAWRCSGGEAGGRARPGVGAGASSAPAVPRAME